MNFHVCSHPLKFHVYSHPCTDDGDESYDDHNLPFRKTQSMRATANRKIQIVDALRQRRLSNSSLDREPMKPSQFKNEDDLTRNFEVQREWQVYVKMNKKVPGTRSVNTLFIDNTV